MYTQTKRVTLVMSLSVLKASV